jgi:hypothetical protein
VANALAMGYRLVDSSGSLTDNHLHLIGEAVPLSERGRVWLTTRIWPSETGFDGTYQVSCSPPPQAPHSPSLTPSPPPSPLPSLSSSPLPPPFRPSPNQHALQSLHRLKTGHMNMFVLEEPDCDSWEVTSAYGWAEVCASLHFYSKIELIAYNLQNKIHIKVFII